MRHRPAEALGQRGAQRPDDQHAAICGLFGPGLQELALLLQRHRRTTATAPLRIPLRGVRQPTANLRLVPTDAGATHTERGSRPLQSRVQKRRQRDRLGTSKILYRLRSVARPLAYSTTLWSTSRGLDMAHSEG